MNGLTVHCDAIGGSKREYESDPHELISVAVTTPVIERLSSIPVVNPGSATGGVLLVTTSAVYDVVPISFSSVNRNVVVLSSGGFTVIAHDDATE